MSKRMDSEIEKIIAACSGDLNGAIRALMMVNEHLESELEAMHAAMATGGRYQRGTNLSLH
jgi:hypothetical protein